MTIQITHLGLRDYQDIFEQMKRFTMHREPDSTDEIWIVEHNPVYTQGQAGKSEHILQQNDIPIIQSDRGGQVTYHGPGQMVIYPLLSLKRYRLSVRCLVDILEQSVIKLLATHYHISSYQKREAPGVYINEQKICSIGLRIKRGFSYHGLALNIDTDLTAFDAINPCGYRGLKMTNLIDHTKEVDKDRLAKALVDIIILELERYQSRKHDVTQ